MMAAIFLGTTLVAGLGMAAVMAAAGKSDIKIDGPWLFAAYTVQFSLAIVAGVIWLRRRGGVGLRLGASWSDAPVILLGVMLVTAASIVLEPLLTLFPEKYLEELNQMIGRGGWAILTTVVAAPLLEEIFFRGLLLESLSRRWSASASVVASAALFGFVHLNPPQAVNAFVMAVIMGYLYLMTRSLVPVIAIHAINNGLAYLALELTGSQSTDTRLMIGNDPLYWIVYAVCAAILVVSLVVMHLRTRTKKREIPLDKKTADE